MRNTAEQKKKPNAPQTQAFSKASARFLLALAFLFPFLIGGYHVFSACLLTILLSVETWLYICRNGRLTVFRNDAFFSVIVLVGAYLLSVLWAVDRGMAAFGFLYMLPLLPAALLLMQCEEGEKTRLLRAVPLSGAAMTALSYSLHFAPAFKGFFTVSGRLSGFFQYPNTFALFLLAGMILCLFDTVLPLRWRLVLAAVLLFGIFESGSRTVFVLTALVFLAVLILGKEKSVKWIMAGLFAAGAAGAAVYVWKTQDVSSVGRFLTTSWTESTWVGRLLYYKDALPVILRHPFGMGYMGYSFTHHAFQTGVYQLMFVHNGWLQFLLDVGWAPTIYFFAALVQTLFSRKTPVAHKLVVGVVFLHSLADFDFSFIVILLLLLLCMDYSKGRSGQISPRKTAAAAVCAVAVLFCAYFGTAQFLQFLHLNEAACALYPPYTTARMELLSECDDIGQAQAIAERILQDNSEIAECYRVRANAAYARGEIADFLQDGMTALEKEPYDTASYNRYGEQILAAIRQYKAAGESQSVLVCERALLQMRDLLTQTEQKTSALAWKIQDKPDFTLSEALQIYIRQLEE